MTDQDMAQDSPFVTGDVTARLMIGTSLVFLLVGMLAGALLGLKLIVPAFAEMPFLSFGRLRPFHTNAILFGWLLQAGIGLMFYIVPRLCNTRLWSEKLGVASWLLLNIAVLGGGSSLLLGYNKGIEYAELTTPFAAVVTVTWVLVAVNIMLTVHQRRVRYLYVALWYTLGTLIWTAVVYISGNFAVLFVDGINQANIAYFYMHNAVGLVFTPIGLAAAYYFIPKSVKAPLYSHTLSIFGFWIIAFVYVWTGAHHMLFGPSSHWLETVAILFSFSLIIPVAFVVTNFYGTFRNAGVKGLAAPEAKFMLAGTTYYLLTCLQGPAHASRTLNQVIGKTDWVVGHAHMAVVGAFTFIAIGGIYYALPRMFRRPLYSVRLGQWHFWISLVLSVPFVVSLMIGGFLQGLAWMDPSIPWIETLAIMKPYWVIRLFTGAGLILAQLLFVWNVVLTIWPTRVPAPVPSTETEGLAAGLAEA